MNESSCKCMGLSRVKLHGLVARPELNGLEGVAEEYDELTGRFNIRLDPIGSLEFEAPKLVLVKFVNLLDPLSDNPIFEQTGERSMMRPRSVHEGSK